MSAKPTDGPACEEIEIAGRFDSAVVHTQKEDANTNQEGACRPVQETNFRVVQSIP
jgi:hypothetical protein